jgi:hypothetical protein
MPPNREGLPWHYDVAPGVLLTAASEEILIAEISEYRARNGIPAGDIEKDLDAYYCGKWPTFCNKDAQDFVPSAPVNYQRPIRDRVAQWVVAMIAKLPKGGFSLVNKPEAEARAVICITCPKNVPWRTGCRGCTNSTQALVQQVKQTKRLPQDQQLYACAAAGWPNEDSVWIKKEDLERKDGLDARCWMLR